MNTEDERTDPAEANMQSSGYLRISKDKFEIKRSGSCIEYTRKSSGKDQITIYSQEGSSLDTYTYSNEELSVEVPGGSKRIYIKY